MKTIYTCSIVTPCYNAENYIKTAMESVLNQTAFLSGRATLDYIIVDGYSTDGTLSIIQETVKNHRLKDCVTIISEPDNGMYDAITKGMKICKGDIFSYLNADDFYNITAIDVVIDIMSKSDVKWLTGWRVAYNDKGHIIFMRNPFLFRKKFFFKGVYGTKLPFLQQESTFWRSELNNYIDFEKFINYKYAGDYYLWIEFSKRYKLFIVETYLGGFRIREGQLTESMDHYYAELKRLINKKSNLLDMILICFDSIFWRFPYMVELVNKFNSKIFGSTHWYFNLNKKKWIARWERYF
jgi:glycosyltransferase involved in cell wall biosynthesis